MRGAEGAVGWYTGKAFETSVCFALVWKRDVFAHQRQAEQVLSGVEVVQKAGAQSTEPHLAIKRGESRGTYLGMVA